MCVVCVCVCSVCVCVCVCVCVHVCMRILNSRLLCLHLGLGSTVAEIDTGKAKVFDKTVFSMLIPPVEKILDDNAHRKSVVLFGIEVSQITPAGPIES